MTTVTRDRRVAAAIGAGCVLAAGVLAVVVDARLDRQWVVRAAMLLLTLALLVSGTALTVAGARRRP